MSLDCYNQCVWTANRHHGVARPEAKTAAAGSRHATGNVIAAGRALGSSTSPRHGASRECGWGACRECQAETACTPFNLLLRRALPSRPAAPRAAGRSEFASGSDQGLGGSSNGRTADF